MVLFFSVMSVLGRTVNIQYAYDDDYYITLYRKRHNPQIRLIKKGTQNFLNADQNLEIENGSEFTKLKFDEYTFLCAGNDGDVITCMTSNNNILYRILYGGKHLMLKTDDDRCIQRGNKIGENEYKLILRKCDADLQSQKFTITDFQKNIPLIRFDGPETKKINKYFSWGGPHCYDYNNRDSLYRDFFGKSF